MMLHWQWCRFESLGTEALYEIIAAREAVFVVEQNCAYLDADGLDRHAWHLIGWSTAQMSSQVLAYARVVDPGYKYPEPSLGRVLTTSVARGQGVGKQLLSEAMQRIALQWPGRDLRISAQAHLQNFYAHYSFICVSAPYDEDGIAHVEMLKSATPAAED